MDSNRLLLVDLIFDSLCLSVKALYCVMPSITVLAERFSGQPVSRGAGTDGDCKDTSGEEVNEDEVALIEPWDEIWEDEAAGEDQELMFSCDENGEELAREDHVLMLSWDANGKEFMVGEKGNGGVANEKSVVGEKANGEVSNKDESIEVNDGKLTEADNRGLDIGVGSGEKEDFRRFFAAFTVSTELFASSSDELKEITSSDEEL